MLIVISPAKTLDMESNGIEFAPTQPVFAEEAHTLAKKLQKLSKKELSKLMSISEKLTELNYDRYQAWEPEFNKANAKPALFAFKGDVYQGLEAETFSQDDLEYAQQHLRILSGLYGVLRPMDLMQAYRLEMGTSLEVKGNQNLYAFWGEKITQKINEALAEQKKQVLVNLASNEYFDSIHPDKIEGTIITPVFKEWRDDKYKIISFNAKKARGIMSAYIIKNRVEEAEKLKLFQEDGYEYNDRLSSEQEWVFTK